MARPNLADSSVEPTDDELVDLARRAFADVPERNREISARLRSDIAQLAREARARSNGSGR